MERRKAGRYRHFIKKRAELVWEIRLRVSLALPGELGLTEELRAADIVITMPAVFLIISCIQITIRLP